MSRKQDNLSTSAHPGWRALYNLLTWIILGITLSQGDGIFVGLFMLGCGLIFDYVKVNPTDVIRKCAQGFGVGVAAIIVIVNLSATFGAFTIDYSNWNEAYIKVESFPFFKGESFPAKWYWLINGVSCFATIVDWVVEYIPEKKTVTSAQI
ncbi:hypothetical protein [Paenibacillus xylanexedens]|uniref:hypothetical protein n=1 Tax=Paenibacillus xylanexedens TaxID=528191 RepID=UPI000F51C8AB|nr:hypothetical protein [Paenibacillus xylanexedens]